MKSGFCKSFLTAAVLVLTVSANAQYPEIPADVQRASDSLMKAATRHSDSAWAIALPIIEKEGREGKPYIPWASRVDELPQAAIPLFPVQKEAVSFLLAEEAERF